MIDIDSPRIISEEEYGRQVRDTLDQDPASQAPPEEPGEAVEAARRAADVAERVPTPSPQPAPAPEPEPSLAERTAQAVADHLRETGRDDYNRQLLRRWQEEAGIVVDGLYGAQTRQALIEHGATDPEPPPPFVGQRSAPPATPTPAPAPQDGAPSGYDPDKARRAAKSVANHLRNAGRANYSRSLLRDWQRLAAITADGLYGGQTRGALVYYGASNAPRAFFQPVETQPYTPPGSEPTPQPQATPSRAPADLPDGYDPDKAREHADTMASHLRSRGRANYSRDLMRTWQRFAGVTADGLYGGGTRGALVYYGASDAPQPFFAPTDTRPYTPPEER